MISLRMSSTHHMLHAAHLVSFTLTPQMVIDEPPQQCQRIKHITSQLHLPVASSLEHLLVTDGRHDCGTTVKRPQSNEDLRYPVVGEHGDLVDVAELAV